MTLGVEVKSLDPETAPPLKRGVAKLWNSTMNVSNFVTFRLSVFLLLGCALVAAPVGAVAQDAVNVGPADPEIAAALKQISATRIRANIEKLVSFGNRSTLSAQDAAAIASGQGIGAAREWIRSEFESYSRDCGGCLEVKSDSFTEAPADRIPKPTEITNVYAVLKGSNPQSAKRIVLVTGHYDSATAMLATRRTRHRERTTMAAALPSASNVPAFSAR